jgi:hypothetical protein
LARQAFRGFSKLCPTVCIPTGGSAF